MECGVWSSSAASMEHSQGTACLVSIHGAVCCLVLQEAVKELVNNFRFN